MQPASGTDGVEYTKAWVLNWSKVAEASWFAVPKFMPVKPVFDARAIIPLIGILGTSYMIFYISNDMHERLMIWAVAGVSILALGIYAYFWTKFKMKMPVWKSVPIEKVMAMDDSRYYALRRKTGIW